MERETSLCELQESLEPEDKALLILYSVSALGLLPPHPEDRLRHQQTITVSYIVGRPFETLVLSSSRFGTWKVVFPSFGESFVKGFIVYYMWQSQVENKH